MANNPNSQATADPYKDLIQNIKSSLAGEFTELISGMFDASDEQLFEMADTAINNEERNRLFELLRNLRDLRPEISDRFLSRLQQNLRPSGDKEAEKQDLPDNDESELSLVDQDELDDLVMIKSLSSSATEHFQESISNLETRLKHLANKTPEIFSSNALSPTTICQAFDDGLNNQFESTNKQILFRIFSDSVLSKLDTMYDTVNQLLIDAGVLPKIRFETPKSPTGTGHAPRPANAPANASDNGDAEEAINQGGYAMTASPGHGGIQGQAGDPGGTRGHYAGSGSTPGSAGTGSGAAGSESSTGAAGSGAAASTGAGAPAGDSSAGSAASASAGVSPAGTDDAGAHTPRYQHMTGGMPASEVSETIGEFLGAPIAPPPVEGADSPSFPASTPQHYGHQEILDALSGIQLKPQFNESQELVFDADAIKQAILAQISTKSGGVVTKSINRIAEKTIDFIELIFDAIIDDTDISDTIKALLLRLQIPVIKASMLDQEFFIYDDHPARIFLDRVTEAGIGVTEHSDEVYIFLNELITRLVNEFELQTSSFEKALNDLNKYIEERDALAQEKEEESQRQVLREHARHTVLQALRSITAGKTLPEPVHPLILKRWPTLMYNHYLSHGKENDEWVTIIEVLRDIIESIQPLTSASELEHLLSTRDALIETTLSYLNRTSSSKQDIETVIQGLKDVHQLHIDNADFPQETESAIEEPSEESTTESTLEPEADEQQASTEETAEARVERGTEKTTESAVTKAEVPKLPGNIVPGMWFQVYTGDDQMPRRCKLSVIILQDSKLVFVNYQGEIIVEKDIAEFSAELEDGRSKLIMGHSVFDHALNRVITSLHTVH